MGGGARYPFPKYVWSPTGGWWPTHPKGVRNTGIAVAIYLLTVYPVFRFSADRERRSPPLVPIPSQSWSAHAVEDDPDYPEKLQRWEEKPGAFSRILNN